MNELQSKSCKYCSVWKQSLFRDLDDDLIDWLKNHKTVMEFSGGEALFPSLTAALASNL
jgi:thioredoxin-related protein